VVVSIADVLEEDGRVCVCVLLANSRRGVEKGSRAVDKLLDK
jgi:hypothetical protein